MTVCVFTACDFIQGFLPDTSPKEDIITVENGYLVVNGVKTEYKVDTEDVVSVENGYLVVNGVETEYEIKNNYHSFGDWKLYNEDATDCESKLYYRICSDCSNIEWKEGAYDDHAFNIVTTQPTCQATGYDTKTCTLCGKVEVCNEKPKAGHEYAGSYIYDSDYHWQKCNICGEAGYKEEHNIEDNVCTVCNSIAQPTEGVIYDVSTDGTYSEVIGYSGTARMVRIAEEYNGLPVTKIYDGAFENTDIIQLVIPDSVTEISDRAFSGGFIWYVILPSSIKSLRLSYCESLTIVVAENDVDIYLHNSYCDIVFSDDVTSIGHLNFEYSSCFLDIPDSVTSIKGLNFYDWSMDPFSMIPNSVTTIGYLYFGYYRGETLTIPDSVTSLSTLYLSTTSGNIDVKISNNISQIDNVYIESAHDNLEYLNYNEYQYCKYIGNENNPYMILIDTTNKNLKSYSIHPNTKTIASYAFGGCSRMTNILIPDSVIGISESAFSGCSSFTDIYYTGSEEEWNAISIDSSNDYYLKKVTIHYNYVPEE